MHDSGSAKSHEPITRSARACKRCRWMFQKANKSLNCLGHSRFMPGCPRTTLAHLPSCCSVPLLLESKMHALAAGYWHTSLNSVAHLQIIRHIDYIPPGSPALHLMLDTCAHSTVARSPSWCPSTLGYAHALTKLSLVMHAPKFQQNNSRTLKALFGACNTRPQ
jgi:hypothetical protein